MAKRATIEISDESIKEAIARLLMLQPKALKKANKSMLGACANKLKSLTVRNLKKVMRNPMALSMRFPTMTPPGLGVMVRVDSGGSYAVVSINNRDSFLLRIFEGGTVHRYIKGMPTSSITLTKRRYRKPDAYRGKIEATSFFAKAIEQAQPDIKRIQEQAFVRSVTRQWKKAGN